MKIIDLINLRAEGKKMPKKIRIDHWCYNFEWIEHESNYYDRNAEIDLMSCLSMDKEELNYEVEIIEEDKKIEQIEMKYYLDEPANICDLAHKVYELIEKLNNMENNK
ncbi:MAG: hypothetical protein VZS44_11260 [Bacilli bacterium]|nr:hypothetical protein [Bacilli bacterium]